MSRIVVLALMVFLGSAAAAAAQSAGSWNSRGLHATRAELEELAAQLEATATESSYSSRLRNQAKAEAALIRKRLEEGDLRVGDGVMLRVEGHQFPEAVSVMSGRVLILPQLGEIPMHGVLRSELQDHMTAEIGRFIRDPVVRARSLIRMEIRGAVRNPGFFMVPSDLLLEDAIMMAGGPAGNARTDQVRIERSRQVIWAGDPLQSAMLQGRTLDQLSVEAGDVIMVPMERGGRMGILREGMMIASGLVSILFLAERLGAF